MIRRDEIQRKLKTSYLKKLGLNVKMMRKHYSERNWRELRILCAHVKKSSQQYGFQIISQKAERVEAQLGSPLLTRSRILPELCDQTHQFFNEIDLTLNDGSFH